jgi:hypothetical protein
MAAKQRLRRWECKYGLGEVKKQVSTAICSLLNKIEKQFKQCALKNGQGPDIWMTELEDYRVKLEDLGLSTSGNQFILNVLNNLTTDYNLQLAIMEKTLNDKMNLIAVDELRDHLK